HRPRDVAAAPVHSEALRREREPAACFRSLPDHRAAGPSVPGHLPGAVGPAGARSGRASRGRVLLPHRRSDRRARARDHREPRRTQPVTRRGATALVRSLPVYSGPGERSQLVDRGRVLERAQVAEVVLAEVRAADDAAKYFAVARPGQLGDEAHSLGPQWPAKYFSDLVLYRPRELGCRRVQRPRDDEDDDRLALYLMGHADRRRFRDRGMRDRGRFDLRGTDALARDLEGVVAASLDVPVPLVVNAGPIAVDPGVRQPRPVRLEVAALLGGRIAPETACHARPGLANDELAHGAAHRTAPVVH